MKGHVYFIGIGGIGMSAIARYYHHAGYQVSGYDRTPSPLTDALQEEGIAIHFEERPDLIPEDTEHTLVIYTPAVPAEMKELAAVRQKGYRLIKRSRALGEIARGKTCLAVAGTHGKTSTSTMLAHIATDSGEGCTAFLGGISKNYESNLLLGNTELIVAEADEFDRSFLQLTPDIAVITSTDADHLDIYADVETMKAAFQEFASGVKKELIVKKGIEELFRTPAVQAKTHTYSSGEKADFYPSEIRTNDDGVSFFTLNLEGLQIENCSLGIPGRVNIENAVAAAGAAWLHGIAPDRIKEALASFQGVRRRFDIRLKLPGHLFIDDYAHHPKELEATIRSVRELFPGRKIRAVFQPHLYTRTRDFRSGFAEALSLADELILLPIYPARELPIPGVTSESILKDVKLENKKVVEKKDLISVLEKEDTDILITFGAGDIDRLVKPAEEMLRKKYA